MIRKYHSHKLQTNPWHREEEPHNNHEPQGIQTSKATSSLYPIKMISKLQWRQSNAQQNVEQFQNHTMGVTINNEINNNNNNRTTALERTAAKAMYFLYWWKKIESNIHLEQSFYFTHKELEVWWFCVWARGF